MSITLTKYTSTLFVEDVVDDLNKGGYASVLPMACLVEPGEDQEWVYVTAKVNVSLDTEMGELLLATAKQVGLDIASLVCDGDKDSDDPLLSKLNGLKKLTVWPRSLLISDSVQLVIDAYENNLSLLVRLRVCLA